MTASMSLAGAIRALREAAGSHDKLAAELGTSRRTVIRWENGSVPKKPEYRSALLDRGISPELFARADVNLEQLLARAETLEREAQELRDALRELLR